MIEIEIKDGVPIKPYRPFYRDDGPPLDLLPLLIKIEEILFFNGEALILENGVYREVRWIL